uniref:Reverse transcriptase domain-containing protein n=1 Tax=Arion vulgaris TaxID=1028688 RepID=A0A0B6ZZC0_9EUPU
MPMLKLKDLLTSIWKKERVPQELKDATIVHLYKHKEGSFFCKLLARYWPESSSINHLEEELLPETQCGFRAGRETADMIVSTSQLQEKCQEQQCNLYIIFVNLTKAFDTANRGDLWRIMGKFGSTANC